MSKNVSNLHYTKGVIICHGKSEYIFAKSLKNNLRLKIEIEGKDNGDQSIQLTSITKYLDNKWCKNIREISKKYDVEYKKKELLNFKIFIIMDIDEKELTDEMIENFKNGNMFLKYDYHDYVVPIFNDDNMDNVLRRMGYSIDSNEKVKGYKKIFPGDVGDLNAFIKIKDKFKDRKDSNMYELLDYLYSCVDVF